MVKEFVWAVSADGVPWKIPVPDDPKCSSEVEWEPVQCNNESIRTIVSSSAAAYAIDKSGKVRILVLPSDIAIRKKLEIYVNQRWYPIIGWQRPLPTDRPRCSDETGKYTRDMSMFDVEYGWKWEEPWTTHIDPRNVDAEGWQYSFSFVGAKWNKICKRQHFVRRKILKRHMRYTAHNEWVELSDNGSRNFVELDIGGSEIFDHGETLLFALGADGQIYRRDGIDSTSPSGVDWIKIPKIILNDGSVVDDVTLMSVSPTLGTMMCITWGGKLFSRSGISKFEPNGLNWHEVATPNNKPLISVSIGTRSMWCITAEGSIWYIELEVDEVKKQCNIDKIRANSYKLVSDGGVCRLSVNKNDRVMCVSNENERLMVRTAISENEPTGRRFLKIIDRADPKDQRWTSIHAGQCSFSELPDYFLNENALRAKIETTEFKKALWRLKIVELLQIRNDSAWKIMNNVKCDDLAIDKDWEDGKEHEEVRKIRCQLLLGDTFKTVSIDVTSQFLEINGDGGIHELIDTAEILGVFPIFRRYPQKHILHVKLCKKDELCSFGFTDETSENVFRSIIENAIREHIIASPRLSTGESMWSISNTGSPRWHCLSELNKTVESPVPLSETKSIIVDGNFDSIDCGAHRSVWAINSMGKIYALNTKYDPLSAHEHEFEYKMVDEKTFEMFEYQKHAIFRGFVTFEGTQKGISAWMCENEAIPKFSPTLHSKNWSWIDSEWRLEGSKEVWSYASDMTGPYTEVESDRCKARRRLWKRKAKYESNRSPWCLIEGPSVRSVRVSKKENDDGKITVVVLTTDGHILVRHGVNRENFTGDRWIQIINDYPVCSLHLQSNEIIWCLTTDALIMGIPVKCDNEYSAKDWNTVDVNMGSLADWLKVRKSESVDIAGSRNILHLRVLDCLYRIDTVKNTVSDPYPMDNLQQAVTNSKGNVVLRGTNITVVREWLVSPYENEKRTIILTKKLERATDMGKWIKCIAMY